MSLPRSGKTGRGKQLRMQPMFIPRWKADEGMGEALARFKKCSRQTITF